jgi:predicted transcriptional regulator
MPEESSQLEKMLNQPIAKKILEFLTKEDLSITQIFKKMNNIDIQTIIAFIAELQRLGLIIPTSNESIERKTNEVENNFENPNEMIQIPRHEWFSPLGLPIPDYNALWEEVVKQKGKSNPKVLDNLIFTIPDTLKEQFKNDNPDPLS